jgi:hypothetical protein
VQNDQAEQAECLLLVRHQLDEQPGETNRFGTEVAANEVRAGGRAVALVEERVENNEHRAEPLRQLVIARHPVRDASVADLVLGSHQPLGHRLGRNHECAGDLDRRQAAQRPQRQRDLSFDRKRRVAAGEDQT